MKTLATAIDNSFSVPRITKFEVLDVSDDDTGSPPSAVEDSVVMSTNSLIFASVKTEPNLYWLDVHTPLSVNWSNLVISDGTHPNDAGYAALGSLISTKVLSIPIWR